MVPSVVADKLSVSGKAPIHTLVPAAVSSRVVTRRRRSWAPAGPEVFRTSKEGM
jgi:hypothetical protein